MGQHENLQGILTPMDVLNYLHRITSPFVMIAEIELSLRRIIKARLSDEDLQMCVQNALASKYETADLPTDLSKMTFSDYVSIITDKNNWRHFAEVFFSGGDQADWMRKKVADRLGRVRDLRNDIFHFRYRLSSEDLRVLISCRDWLQVTTSALEATRAASLSETKKVTPASPEKPFVSQRGKWDEPSFLAELEKKRGPQAVDAARRILAWAQEKKLLVEWGKGPVHGSFAVIMSHRGKNLRLFSVWTGGGLSVLFGYLRSEVEKLELLRKLNGVKGVSLSDSAISGRPPGIHTSVLENQATLQQLLGVFEWVIEEIRKA